MYADLQSVVGIDFGNLSSKIGVARHRGIDIIVNEVSNRATPYVLLPSSNVIADEAAPSSLSLPVNDTLVRLPKPPRRPTSRTLSDP